MGLAGEGSSRKGKAKGLNNLLYTVARKTGSGCLLAVSKYTSQNKTPRAAPAIQNTATTSIPQIGRGQLITSGLRRPAAWKLPWLYGRAGSRANFKAQLIDPRSIASAPDSNQTKPPPGRAGARRLRSLRTGGPRSTLKSHCVGTNTTASMRGADCCCLRITALHPAASTVIPGLFLRNASISWRLTHERKRAAHFWASFIGLIHKFPNSV